jgi:multiple sugar transport system permease protein
MAIVQDTDVLTSNAAPKRKLSMAQRDTAWGLAFLSPWLIGLGLFTVVPMIVSFVLSFTNFNLVHPSQTHFVFLDNYAWMLTDELTQKSMFVTLKFAVVSIPLTIFSALGIAILVNQKLLVGKRIFRTLFFMPVQIPLVASTVLWLAFLNGSTGWLKYLVEAIAHTLGQLPFLGFLMSVQSPDWFTSTTWALPGLILVGIWGIGNAMLIFLAGLQSVPTELYEASRVDGAGPWKQFRHVTLPMISPVFFYNLLLNTIGTFQYFTQAYVLGAGATGKPDHELYFYNIGLYNQAWSYSMMGRGCALAWFLFAIILIISVVMFRTSAKWVFYAGAER